MTPSEPAKHAAAVTLAQSKMFEFDVPYEHRSPLPTGLDLDEQFPLALGIIGDFAAQINRRELYALHPRKQLLKTDVVFAAQVLQAYQESHGLGENSNELLLIAASAFLLADLPGRSLVLTRKTEATLPPTDYLLNGLRFLLGRPWSDQARNLGQNLVLQLCSQVYGLYKGTARKDTVHAICAEIVQLAYEQANEHNLLFADLLCAVALKRSSNAAFQLLPQYTPIPEEIWSNYLLKPTSVKELWPSQRILGANGLYAGQSAVVQMPTSTGKTRAVELIIRAAFMSARANFAVVVAPFRALCQEISQDLKQSFSGDNYKVNQLSDSPQEDYNSELEELLNRDYAMTPSVIVITPEKFLYLLRREPSLTQNIGLVLYDEGHQFDSGVRGVTYELLLTSLKKIVSSESQVILISAVIENATSIAGWLLGNHGKVVIDTELQSRRLVAFAEANEYAGLKIWFYAREIGGSFFQVPIVATPARLSSRPRERTIRYFPEYSSTSIALYIGMKQVPKGASAIYCQSKASVSKIIRDFVEDIWPRGIEISPPSSYSDPGELSALVNLYAANFGDDSFLTRGAQLGLFGHHANTPQGIRLAVEHAMRQGRIKLVICTSTLAQGVNLPIRYLLVTNASQGSEDLSPRDFHNLMGRAGRAGMHTEGTVIFTNPKLFSERHKFGGNRDWEATARLLEPTNIEGMGSTLLELLHPLTSDRGEFYYQDISAHEIASTLAQYGSAGYELLANAIRSNARPPFSSQNLIKQLKIKFQTVTAIESFLMAYHGSSLPEDFSSEAFSLCTETLAFYLSDASSRVALTNLFTAISSRINTSVPDTSTQYRYGKTLLGLDDCIKIDSWVINHSFDIATTSSEHDMLVLLWPLLTSFSHPIFSTVSEPESLRRMCLNWISGKSYAVMLSELGAVTYPYGNQNRFFTVEKVVGLCEKSFGHEFSLILSAVTDAFSEIIPSTIDPEPIKIIGLLQRRIKYGLPNESAVAFHEAGFSDRIIAQVLDGICWGTSVGKNQVRDICIVFAAEMRTALQRYPSYYSMLLEQLIRGG